MAVAPTSASATPRNRSGVIALNNSPIQPTRPLCGLNSRALMPAVPTPIRMKVRMNRGVRKLCMRLSFAWGPRMPADTDRLGTIDRFHPGRGEERHDQTLGVAIHGERVDASGLREWVGDRDPLWHLGDM